jgi:Fructose-2,6-bisphosphatase
MEIGKINDLIRKSAQEKNVSVQSVWDDFFFEGFLELLSRSKHSSDFVLKGGYLLESCLGITVRSTMDLDLNFLRNQNFKESIKSVFSELCHQSNGRDVVFEIVDFSDLQVDGVSVTLLGKFSNVKKRFSIDVVPNSSIVPTPKRRLFQSGITGNSFEMLVFPFESLIAEKVAATVSKGLLNSRSKDLVDLFLLRNQPVDHETVKAAIVNVFYRNRIRYRKSEVAALYKKIESSENMQSLYERYVSHHPFAENISWNDAVAALKNTLEFFAEDIEPLDLNGNILTLVRHGEDETDKVGGWSSTHLTAKGIKQVRKLKKEIHGDFDLFLSSDLPRAVETSQILQETIDRTPFFDSRFRETNNGILANMKKRDFLTKYPGFFFSSFAMDERYPEGESPSDFFGRVSRAFIELVRENKNKRILLVTHGGVITVILCLVYGLPYSNKLKIQPEYASQISLGEGLSK